LAKLVYIGGYGRSGSTLLEYLLAQNPKVVACGEIARHLRSFGRHKICTCGEPMQACPVWGDFQHKSGRLKGSDHEDLGLALLEHVSGQYAVMVDSSKTAWGSMLMPFPWPALPPRPSRTQSARGVRVHHAGAAAAEEDP
jgi:hypothetical protein